MEPNRMNQEDYEYGEREYEVPDPVQMNELMQDRFDEWFRGMAAHPDATDDVKEAFKKGWEEAEARFRDLLDQIKEELDGVN